MDVCSHWDYSVLRRYTGYDWLELLDGAVCYTCALLTSDKETFQPTRVTEQRSLKHRLEGIQGLKQANMAAYNWCLYTHSALPAKNTPIWLVHGTGPSGTGRTT